MAGRKAAVPPTELIKVLVSFKDQILEIIEDTTSKYLYYKYIHLKI